MLSLREENHNQAYNHQNIPLQLQCRCWWWRVCRLHIALPYLTSRNSLKCFAIFGRWETIMHLRNFACFCLSGGLLSTWFQESLPKNALYKSKTIQQIWKRLTSYFQMYNNPGEHSHTTYHRLTQNLSMEAGRMHCFFGLRFAKYNFDDFTGHQ